MLVFVCYHGDVDLLKLSVDRPLLFMLSPIIRLKLYVLFASKRMSTAEAFLGSMAVKFVEPLDKNKDKINFPSTKTPVLAVG